MVDKIAKIITFFTEGNMLLNETAIINICKIIKDTYELDDFIKKVDFNYDEKSGTKAFFNQDKKTITIYLRRIHNEVLNCLNSKDLLDKNILITRIILHEFIHALQYKKCFTDSDFETELYKDCYAYFYNYPIIEKIRRIKYKRYHNIFPIERMAEIDSARICLEIANVLNTNSDYYYIYYQFLIDGYYEPKKFYAPTEIYAMKTHSRIIMDQDFYSKSRNEMLCKLQDRYTLYERLRFGLLISNDEYKLIRKSNN